MPTSLLALFVTLRFILRARVDLQVENLALRQQIGVLQRSQSGDRGAAFHRNALHSLA
jgi:hypothetical protein